LVCASAENIAQIIGSSPFGAKAEYRDRESLCSGIREAITGILNAVSRCDRAGQNFSGKTEMLVWLGVRSSQTGHNQACSIVGQTYPDPRRHQPRLESLLTNSRMLLK
jgi:hypothetical protein